MMLPNEEISEDWLLNNQVRLLQPKDGYRAGMDAVLLAASLRAKQESRVLELGCGAGGALFSAAYYLPDAQLTGVEREPQMVELARLSADLNGVKDRVEIINSDILDLPASFQNQYDLVFSNPPYFEASKIPEPSDGRKHAYLADVPLAEWLKKMFFAAKPKARITLIHRAGELGEILSYLAPRCGQIEVMPVRSAPGDRAKRVIVTARKALKRGELILHDGLTMYKARGGRDYEDRAAAIMRGEPLDWA